jgi:hypothetical protein
MDHPQAFLLKKIIESNENKLPTLKQLHGKHVNDIAQVMKEFTELTIIEVIERLNNGETLVVNDEVQLSLERRK